MSEFINKSEILSKKFGSEILYFTNVVSANFPIYDMDKFIKKINTIKVEDNPSSLKDLVLKLSNDHPICYYPIENKIFIIKDNVNSENIFHELFHMLSSFNKDNIIYSGFKQSNFQTKVSIGKGLNEGYTQFLKERYFGQRGKEKYIYPLEKHIARHLEIIIGQRKMEEYYSESNLPKLVKYLSIYDNYENIEELIENIDYISDNFKKSDVNIINEVNNKLKNVLKSILDMYIKKQDLLLSKKLISDTIYQKHIEDFLASLATPITYKDKIFQSLDYEDVENILNNNNLNINNKIR